MKFVSDSKTIADMINAVVGTTGASEVNFEVGKAGLLLVKADVKGTAHHERTEVVVDEGKTGDKVTINVSQFLGLIGRRGEVTVDISENSLIISGKGKKTELRLTPVVEIGAIENSKDTLELRGVTLDALKTHMPSLSITNLFTEVQPFVMVRCENETLEVMCMDSVHGAYYKMPVTNQADFSFNLTHDALQKLLGIIANNPEAVFAVEESRIFVQSDRCSISFPKTQAGTTKLDFNVLNALKKRCIGLKKGASSLSGVNREVFVEDVSACKYIASEKDMVQLSANSKGTGYLLKYSTTLGSTQTTNKCEAAWSKGDVVKLNPYLMLDFLESMGMFETISLIYAENLIFSHIVTGDGYEAFNVCSCG